jgi:pimeloyl-ACP methyl ester carboxylesterase
MPHANNGNVKIYWEEEGSGEPLLLIMGLGYTLEMWHRVRPLLAERFRVIVFDNRGVGRSDVPEPGYSISDMARDAVAVLDAAGMESAHVLGISMGGYIAQALTIEHPERVRSLVLGCTACGGPDAVRADAEVLEALVARGAMEADEGIRVMIPFVYDSATEPAAIEEDLAIRLRTYPSEKGYSGQLQAILSHSTWERLGEVSVPTLVLHGQSDRLVPHANGEDVARRIPGARFVSLANASHIFFTDQPAATGAAMEEFFDEVVSAPTS